MGRNKEIPESIAVLTAELSDAYQAEVWLGLAKEAGNHSRQLVCFLGSQVESPIAREAAANTVYDLAHAGAFRGLIIISSAISTYMDAAQVQYLFDAHRDLPKISIGVPVQGAGSIIVEGRAAMIALTEHLIQVHGRRRFAVIAGPKWHVESEERRIAFLECMDRHGIPFKDEWLIHGTFVQESGRQSAARLLDLRPDLDALVCLNDRMALGAMDEIKNRGLNIPGDLSLVGFDGIEETEFCSPPLTTVLQPLTEAGSESIRELNRLLQGHPPRNLSLGCRPIFRESCGCPPVGAIPVDSTPPGSNGGQDEVPDRRSLLTRLALGGRPAEFLQMLNQTLAERPFPGDDAGRWSRFLLDLRKLLKETGKTGDSDRLTAEPLDLGHILVGEVKRRHQGSLRMERTRRNNIVREVGISLSEAFEIPELLKRLSEGLNRIGIDEAFLILYEDAEDTAGTGRGIGPDAVARLLFSLGPSRTGPERFPRRLFLPPELLSQAHNRTWMLIPLVFHNRAIGHLILPGNMTDTEIYETLSKQIASSLTGAILMEQVRGNEQSLEAEVKKRTEELVETNAALRTEVENRIRLEREVVEISKQTMERIGRDLHDDLCQHLAGISLHITALQSTLDPDNLKQAAKVSQVNELLRDSIERAKSIVRGLLPPGLKEDGIITAVGILADNVRKNSGKNVIFRADPAWHEIRDDRALEVFRIIQEALNNSVKHSGADKISIKLGKSGPRLSAEVRDNGSGIPEGSRLEGMGLKIMKYRAEKAGSTLDIGNGARGTRIRIVLQLGEGDPVMRKRFLVVDDHPVFRQGLVALIETIPAYTVAAEVGGIEEALGALAEGLPDIVLVDITLNRQNGLDLVRTIKASYPDLPVLIVSMHDEIVYAERALKAGARGYVMKQEDPATLLQAIRAVLAGRIYLSDTMNEKILEAMYTVSSPPAEGTAALIDRLSERELEILEYFGQGYGAKEIAQILNLSVKTVHSYRDHLKEKLQIGNAAEVRRFAVKWYQSTIQGEPSA